jgi:guanine nucleotide-binding protein G(I)/G(S)/G(T) subunit beta-1
MTCAYEPTESALVAAGGLDNLCTVYRVSESSTIETELQYHDGYLSSCRFLDVSTILTSSGDSTCALWDLAASKPKHVFSDHSGDVMALDVSPTDPWTFVSGSCDCSAKLWDARASKCVMTFPGSEGDVNAVAFMRNGLAFVTGTEEGIARMQDIRSFGVVNEFANDVMVTGISGVAFSKSGRLLFTGCDDNNVYAWDTLEDRSSPLQVHEYHQQRVAAVALPLSGQCVAAASWDTDVSLWA